VQAYFQQQAGTPTPTLTEMMNLVLEFGGIINELWTLFLTVSLAIVGWIVTVLTSEERQFGLRVRLCITAGFALFAAINFASLSEQYGRLNQLMAATRLVAKSITNTDVTDSLEPLLAPFTAWSLYVHVVVSIIVVIVVWAVPNLTKRGRSL
jgi:hypothetical protein